MSVIYTHKGFLLSHRLKIMNIRKLVRAYIKKRANYPMPSSLSGISFKDDPELWLNTAGTLLKKLIKPPGSPKVDYVTKGFLPYATIQFSEFDKVTITDYKNTVSSHVIGRKSYSDYEDLWNLLVQNFIFYKEAEKPADLQKILSSTIGLDFTKEIDFDSSSKVYLMTFENKAKKTKIVYGYDTVNKTETFVLQWENNPPQTYSSLDEMLDAVPTEYDSEVLLFRDKKMLEVFKQSMNSAIIPFTGQAPKWKVKETKGDYFYLDFTLPFILNDYTQIEVSFHMMYFIEYDYWNGHIGLNLYTPSPLTSPLEDYQQILNSLPYALKSHFIRHKNLENGMYKTTIAVHFKQIPSSNMLINTTQETFQTLGDFKWI